MNAWQSARAAAQILLAVGLAAATPLAAQTLDPVQTAWSVTAPFGKDNRARTNLSGAACASKTPPFRSCLIVNDEKNYAQFFAIEGTKITPGKVIRLVDKSAPGNPDAEGAAYDRGHFYVTGSHGRSRNHPDQDSDPSYVVFRFPVDPNSGDPTFEVSEDEVVGVQASTRLRQAIIDGDRIGAHFDKKLSKNGVNFEGIAVKDGRMYLGLRGPSEDGTAFILSVDAEAVFTTDQPLNARVEPLALGSNAGIRDLAAVGDGVLVLSGPVNDQDVTPAVFLWDDKQRGLRKLAELSLPGQLDGAKAETLLVLRDVEGQPWRVLVMFDGPKDGAPTEYLLPR